MSLQGGTVLEFSIDGPETSYGLVQNYTITDQTERATARGANGDTVSVQEFDQTQTLSLNYMVLGTPTGAPAIGTTFSFEGSTWYLESIADGKTIDGFATKDITGTAYPNLGS